MSMRNWLKLRLHQRQVTMYGKTLHLPWSIRWPRVSSIDGTALLNSPANGLTQPVTSPIKVSSSYQSSGTILGRVAIYSDTYVLVGDTNAIHGSAPTGSVSFAPSVTYHLETRGLQEGLVAFYVTNQNNIVTSNQVV